MEDLAVDGRRVLKWLIEKWGMRAWSGFVWLRMKTSSELCEHVNRSSGYMKGRKYLDQMNYY